MNKVIVFFLTMGFSMFGFGKKEVEVEFYEGKERTPFAVSNVPIDQLPDTFEIDTVMHLGNEDWIVVTAEPAEKSKFRKIGKLSLYLEKSEIIQMDPSELLYSLPTISNDLASVENSRSVESVVVLREDDWRQFEFLSKKFESTIEEELTAIENIYKNFRDGVGFKDMHLRKGIDTPLEDKSLTVKSLESSFDITDVYGGIAFNEAEATIVGGFAIKTSSGWLLWGQADESGNIKVLNISPTQDSSVDDVATEIDDFTGKYGLYLVDWPRLFWCGPDKARFSEYGQ
ncbi:hypothetical protein [Pseudoteredinibacter isoporae]|uniref:Uncharacterized protein n=1 Tax=Pseudoteredinibacter isoporae TaxID=570281 RepID=A0A7X0MW78_9GAMM|nr:hypothetical protein [Pseudoteredinibacter isoporae]MBB6521910.1 hypothetical protein [Pseudoteredinibacter isoporae]NHO87452.1 hypothetical protein [Pseudoteredinibacter isoporae]NIB24217.1 hypothetical protein [Pseudoteredinibacter isoporae]